MGRKKIGAKKYPNLCIRIGKKELDELKKITKEGEWKNISDFIRTVPTLFKPTKILTLNFRLLKENDRLFVKVSEVLEDRSERVIYNRMPIANFVDTYKRLEKFYKKNFQEIKGFVSNIKK